MEEQRNARKFNSDFNELDKFFTNEVNGVEGHFYQNMVKFLRNNPRYRRFEDDIKYINDVRKVIVHDEKNEEAPVIPTDSLCKKLEFILKQFKNPPKWDSIAIPENKIYSCSEDDLISDIVKEMAKNTYTHVPVVKEGVFQWLLSESVYVQWLSDVIEKDGICAVETRVSELKQYIENTNDEFVFMSRETDIYQIKEEFEKAIGKKKGNIPKRLGVIFITNSGKKTEKILGLITAWDVSKDT